MRGGRVRLLPGLPMRVNFRTKYGHAACVAPPAAGIHRA